MRCLNIGLLGCGRIGGGFVEVIRTKAIRDRLAARAGLELNVVGALVKDPTKARPAGVSVATHANDLLNDQGIDLFVETMGGVEPATEYAMRALARGKHVVSSNKAMVASSYPALRELSSRTHARLLFEASVGGGVPIIRTLLNKPFRVQSIEAVLNATTNFILGHMERGCAFEGAVNAAREGGYAEPDPQDDLDGTDAAYKLCILAAVGLDRYIPPASILHRGINKLTVTDVQAVLDKGQRYKLIARAQLTDPTSLEMSVKPELVQANSFLGRVEGAQNGFVISDDIGETLLLGEGAGVYPTASSLLDDVVSLASYAR